MSTRIPRRRTCCSPWGSAWAGTASSLLKAGVVVEEAEEWTKERMAAATQTTTHDCAAAAVRNWGSVGERRTPPRGCRQEGKTDCQVLALKSVEMGN